MKEGKTMKPYAKLRAKMTELDISNGDVANFLNKSPSYVSYRLNNRYSWKISDAYKVLELLNLPEESISFYFPPDAGLPKRSKGKQ